MVYKGGIKPVHLLMDHNRHKDFKELCHKEGKSVNEKINELVNEKLECNAIAENDMPGEYISCLGYTPKPAQQKIIDNIDDTEKRRFQLPTLYELIDELKNLHTPQQIGKLQGEYSRGLDVIKRRMNQVKIGNLRI